MGTTRGRIGAIGLLTAVLLTLGAVPALAVPVPVLECVAANADGSYTAVFGVQNDGPAITIAVGNNTNGRLDNRFNGVADRGQPTVFASGRTTAAFALVVTDGSPEVWHLGETSLQVKRDDTPCGDIPAASDVPAVLLGGLAAAAGAAWAIRRIDGPRVAQ